MGIGKKGNSLWAYINSSERVVKLSDIAGIIGNDSGNTRIAVDAAYVKEACFHVVWNMVTNLGNDDNFNAEYIINKTKELIISKNNTLIKNGFKPIWCMDGDRSSYKTETEKRIRKNDANYRTLIETYMKAKILAEKSPELKSRLKKYEYIETAYNRYDDITEDIVRENMKSNNDNSRFEEHYVYIGKYLLPITRIKPKSFDKMVYKVFEEHDGFKNSFIRIPSISEGEKLASILTQMGYCEGVYSTDSDCLIFGAKFIFFKKKYSEGKSNPNYKNSNQSDPWYSLYSYQEVIKNLAISPQDMINLAIRMGNDFNDRIPRDRFEKIYSDIKTYKDNYDMYDYNILHCGIYNPDICYSVFAISKEIKALIADEFKKMIRS